MKKKVFLIFLFILVLSAFLISAAENDTAVDERGYSCLEEKLKDGCSTLSTEEKIFSLLASGDCRDSITSDSKYKINTKLTAQAILALSTTNGDTDEGEEWLLSQNRTPANMDWLMQIESINETSCTIKYSGSSYTVTVGANKKINTGAGTCLTLYGGNYWLKIAPSCYTKEFEISCKKAFSTNLLYKKTTSDVIYVASTTNIASADGTTTVKVNSYCFAQGSACDYEASLWAALVLNFRGYDVSAYLPYLITLMDEAENMKYLPESFLYSLTTDFRNELLLKQLPDGYWKVSDNKFYDTALAILPFQNEDLNEKTTSQNWLKGVQGTDGCWGSIRDTAFILYSFWPKPIQESAPDMDDCETSGLFCMSSASCLEAGGTAITGYDGCFGTNICCNKEKPLESCEVQGGDLCNSDEQCLGGDTVESSDSNSEKFCCLDGTCGIKEVSECESNMGLCKVSCSDNEESSSYTCTTYSDICCVAKEKKSYLWLIIILLVILIALTVLGIIYRKQVKEFFFKAKAWVMSKFKKGGGKPSSAPSGGGPRFPPTSSARVFPGAVQRRIIPQQRPAAAPARKPEGKSDFDEVLRKLKEIGK